MVMYVRTKRHNVSSYITQFNLKCILITTYMLDIQRINASMSVISLISGIVAKRLCALNPGTYGMMHELSSTSNCWIYGYKE